MNYECSGRHESGHPDPMGCRLPATGGFLAARGTEARQVWLYCGTRHNHPSAKPLDVLTRELLGSPRLVGEPLPPSSIPEKFAYEGDCCCGDCYNSHGPCVDHGNCECHTVYGKKVI